VHFMGSGLSRQSGFFNGASLRSLRWVALAAAATTAGCGLIAPPAPPPRPAPAPSPVPAPSRPTPPVAAPVPPAPQPEARARDWTEYREQAARRMVAMNPGKTYLSTPPDPLMAIPVLEVQLNADGSVAAIKVERYPREVRQTVQMAIDAVHRGAPYGSVAHLPRPWRFTEVFLFDYEFRFKPRSLD
jgi:hypothetical protein